MFHIDTNMVVEMWWEVLEIILAQYDLVEALRRSRPLVVEIPLLS